MTLINITKLQNPDNIMDMIGAANSLAERMPVVFFCLSVMIFMFIITNRSTRDLWRSLATSSFVGLVLGLLFYTWKFENISIMPEWFLWIVGIIMAISVTLIYVKGD